MFDPGRNCWGVERASRFYCIQDAADYFQLVRRALLNASETVFILGWDITAQTDLCPDLTAPHAPTRLDELLVYVARRRPRLRCYILVWDYGVLYTLQRDPFTRWRLGWRTPRGIRFGFDDHHPNGGCHHQKVVVVDDHLAFCGGIDLTSHRWDRSAHLVEEPARKTVIGVAYGPYHEVQAMVMGPAARRLGALARDRWRVQGPDRMPPVGSAADDLWPSDITPDLTHVDVAIARTMPASGSQPAIRECEALFLDSIGIAKHTVYIESQYFTSETLSAALAARLREPNGPEVIVVAPKECQGWLEKTTMGAFREASFRQLLAADAHNRLRLVYPCASRSRDVPTFVHSKVMVVDDVLARVGSANCSDRSLGMDTECDLAVDAGGIPKVRAGILHIRDRLLAEHMGLPVETVAHETRRRGSIRALIDAREKAERTLVRIDLPERTTTTSPILRDAVDPGNPVAFSSSVESLVPAFDATTARGPLRIWILPALVVVAATSMAWKFSPALAMPADSSALWMGVGVFVAAGLLLIPLELLAFAAAVGFGAVRGGAVALIGSLAAAVFGYLAGRAIGTQGLARWISRRSYRSVRQLSARGVGGMVMLRLAHIASAGSIHLLCGARGVPFVTYMTGTAIAFVPIVGVPSGLGGLFRRMLHDPTLSNVFVTLGAAVLMIVSMFVLRGLLFLRHLAPAVSSHRDRAEFG